MKKKFAIFASLLLVLTFALVPGVLFATNAIHVTIEGERVVFADQQPVNVENRTLVPVRGVFEQLGFDVDWDGDAQQATLSNATHTVVITIGSAQFTTNGASHTLDVPAQVIGDRTMVPLRLPLESVGFFIGWDGATNTVLISSEPIVVPEPPPEPPAPTYSLQSATVSRVIDGDTIELANGARVRFIGVDAPETGAPGAAEATAFVRDRVLNQTVWLESDGNDTDRFGRYRRYVWIRYPSDTRDSSQIQSYMLNALLLSNGLAEVSIVGTVRNEALFRSIAVPLVHVAQAPAPTPQPQAQATGQFIGNRNSQIFHRSTCGTLPAARNRVYFNSREAAINAGHRPCQRCRP